MSWVWTFINVTVTVSVWESGGYLLRRFVHHTKRIEVPRGPTNWAINPVTGERTIFQGDKDE